jgi:hypothetical protein
VLFYYFLLFLCFPIQTDPNSDSGFLNIPTVKVTTTRYTTRYTTPSTTTTRRTYYTPTTRPPYFGGGGNRYGDDDGGSIFGGGGYRPPPTTRYTTRATTRKPSSGGFFSGFSDILSGQIGDLINDALKGGSSKGGGGFGSFFDTRPIQENKGYRGGLFSENSGSQNQPSASSRPTTRYAETTYNRSPSYGWNTQGSAPSSNPTPSYGWRV